MPILSIAQDCDCKSTFSWVKSTFEDNDAGFSYSIQTKGLDAYEKHSQAIEEKTGESMHPSECASLIGEWLAFFRTGHVDFQWVETDEGEAKDEHAVPENWEIVDLSEDDFSGSSSSDGFQGLWKPLNRWDKSIKAIGIRKVGEGYKGYVVESEDPAWAKGQLKLEIEKTDARNKAVYYYPNRSPKELDEVDLLGENYLQVGDILFERIESATRGASAKTSIQKYVNSYLTSKPLLTQLDASTVLIRIPSFNISQKEYIDELLQAHHDQITSSKNLIIDLRNNGGGGDESYYELVPLIYTNPIRTLSVEFRSTPLNNELVKAYLATPELDEETREELEGIYKKLIDNLGSFVNIYDEAVDIEEQDSIHANPQEVAIIIDQECGSTTEQFLLAAKQSKKVKLYGRTTFGALDISNMNVVDSPCQQFKFAYAMSRSMRIPGMAIDGKGIQPDYYIDRSIPKYEWVDFVQKIMGQ